MTKGTFNPQDYLMDIKGKPYLKTPHRVLWFKTEHPENGAITTELVFAEPFPLFKAYVYVDGVLMATAHGSAQVKAGSVYAGREFEKAETAAIGRALGNAGYGTQFSEDDEGDDLVDSPVERKQQQKPATNGKPNTPAFPTKDAAEKFIAHWEATDNLTQDELKVALNIEYFRDFAGTLAQANDAVQVYLLGKVPFGAKK